MNDNMRYWDKVSKPPTSVLKPISAGRLKGKSDINPQWRLQAMTELFGPCGIGWKYTIDKLWLERGAPVKKEGGTYEEVAAFALVSLYYKEGDEWSAPIPGIGGSMFVEMEKGGPHNSDEAFKMAVTDALSVAMKAAGMAAEIYLGNFDGSKYTGQTRPQGQQQPPKQGKPAVPTSQAQQDLYAALAKAYHGNVDEMADALRHYSGFTPKATDANPNPEERWLKLADLEHGNDNEKFQRWVAGALDKYRKDAQTP